MSNGNEGSLLRNEGLRDNKYEYEWAIWTNHIKK